MSRQRYPEEFKIEAVKQVTERGRPVAEAAQRLYLAVALALFSRQVIGWSMQPMMCSDLALDALLAALWRRKPQQQMMIHSDQGIQFSSSDWQTFLKANNVTSSMSRRGNCHDNAIAERFFQRLKRE